MEKEIEAEEIGRGVIEDLSFPYILMLIHKNYHIFQDGFFNLVVHGILQPQPERTPFQAHQKFYGI
jgi:hypothetical protein